VLHEKKGKHISKKDSIIVAAQLSEKLAQEVRISSTGKEIRIVAGTDVAYCGSTAVAAVVLYDMEGFQLLEEKSVVAEVLFPYVPGYLFFREGPLVIAALEKLKRRPDLLMVDGHGTAHPKKAGYACLLGAFLGLPSIGCAKSRLVGEYMLPGKEKGASSPLIFGEETVGAVVRTRQGTRPVFVSPGHLVALNEAVAIVLRCALKFRIPEPLRAADALARKIARQYAEKKPCGFSY
jgi:deoxyribonuclease V